METVTLNDGIRMPLMGFGTFQMVDEVCERAVETALGAGYRMIDTAEAYGNEAAVGRGLRASGVPRSEVFLVTKVNFRSYGRVRETVEASLEKLAVDYLDLVLLHWPFGDVYAAWRELEALQREGVVRSIGVSNFEPARLIDLIEFNEVVPSVNQIETYLFCQRLSEGAWLRKYNVAHMAYAPLGQGLAREMFECPEVVAAAQAHGKTPQQVALRYLVQRGISVIPKSVHDDRMRDNLDALRFQLTEEEMAAMKLLDKAAPMIGRPEDPALVEQAMTW